MSDFASSLVTNEELYAQALRSEQLRERGNDITDRLEQAERLLARIKYLRHAIKQAYSLAVNSGSNKAEREVLKKQARELEIELETSLTAAKHISGTIGNIIIFSPPADLSLPFLRPVSIRQLATNALSRRFVVAKAHGEDEFHAYIMHGGCLGALPQSTQLSKKVLEALPCLDAREATRNDLYRPYSFRYFYDPNQTIRVQIFEELLRWLEVHLGLPPHKGRRQHPFHRLPMSSAWSVSLTSSHGHDVMARIDLETDYVARNLDIRISKQYRTKLATSPFPESIYVTIFRVDLLRTIKGGDQADLIRHPDRDLKTDFLQALRSENYELIVELSEDLLESQSYLGGGFAPCALDEQAMDFVQAFGDLKVPPVQYPSLHRWRRHLKANSKSFVCCSKAGCSCNRSEQSR